MIPKIIHYCWFGKGKYSELTEKCIDSWRKILPDYKVVLWNEDSFDVNSVIFTREAYAAKKYAFVADYVRLYALKKFGGIYLDTDVEVLRTFDDLLQYQGFTGVEDTLLPACGVIGCEPAHTIICEFLDFYKDRSFYNDIGEYDLTPNPCHFEKILSVHGYKKRNIRQHCDGFEIFPDVFFNPSFIGGEWAVTTETKTIHHYTGSWVQNKDERQLAYERKIQGYVKLFGQKKGEQIYRNVVRIQQRGISGWIKFCVKKVLPKR